jgi:hypothetical protein
MKIKTTTGVVVEHKLWKRLTPLLQGYYQNYRWQTVADVIAQRAWVWLQRITYSAREKKWSFGKAH